MARKYRCMFCDITAERPKLIDHINKKHQEMIPEGYDGARLVFDMINKTTGGKCRVCGAPTPWNGSRYDILCDNPKCKEKMREEYKKNMLRVRGTYNILNDPEQQKLMLSHRKISGKYQHSDGGIISYTGAYEKAALEFMDLMLQIPSKDIFSPGPTMEYIYQGKKHIYIPDFYLPVYNLIIEIKDGGDNKNLQDSPSRNASREKTVEKERVITDKGIYNYIRLTNNEFPQLIEMFMLMKQKIMNGDDSKTIKINEDNIITDFVGAIDKKVSKIFSSPFDKVQHLCNIMTRFQSDSIEDDDRILVRYKSLTPEEISKVGLGLCWDYCAFEANYFKEKIPDIKEVETYFIASQERSGMVETHTFLIFEYLGYYYWFEAYWEPYIGIRGFKTKKDCLNYIVYLFYKYKSPGTVVYLMQYNSLDNNMYGLTKNQILTIFKEALRKSNYMPNKTMTNKYVYKYTPQNIKSIKEVFTYDEDPNNLIFY